VVRFWSGNTPVFHRFSTETPRNVEGMNPLQRSRRLQTGLASLGIVGAIGASVGIGAATHTPSSSGTGGSGTTSGDDRGSGAGQTSGSHHRSRHTSPTSPRATQPPVTAPAPNPPQATTSGS
jgi:hypothetical protein